MQFREFLSPLVFSLRLRLLFFYTLTIIVIMLCNLCLYQFNCGIINQTLKRVFIINWIGNACWRPINSMNLAYLTASHLTA